MLSIMFVQYVANRGFSAQILSSSVVTRTCYATVNYSNFSKNKIYSQSVSIVWCGLVPVYFCEQNSDFRVFKMSYSFIIITFCLIYGPVFLENGMQFFFSEFGFFGLIQLIRCRRFIFSLSENVDRLVYCRAISMRFGL